MVSVLLFSVMASLNMLTLNLKHGGNLTFNKYQLTNERHKKSKIFKKNNLVFMNNTTDEA